MKRLLAGLALVMVMALLGGCYVSPGYSYVRGNGYGGDAYYGSGPAVVYDGGYYAPYGYGAYGYGYGGYGYGYGYGYGGYGYGCCVVGGWYGGRYYRGGRGYPGGWHGNHGGAHSSGGGHWNGGHFSHH